MSTEFAIHKEGKASIYLPIPSSSTAPPPTSTGTTEGGDTKTAPKNVFLNPVQEFNRDISIVAIRTWSELFAKEKADVWDKRQAKRMARQSKNGVADGERSGKRRKGDDGLPVDVVHGEPAEAKTEAPREWTKPGPYKFTVFEALAASGLRSIRYALELPLIRWVLANDLSRSAIESMKTNIALNDLIDGNTQAKPLPAGETHSRIRVNEGDCSTVMYTHRAEKDRFDVVDLDPYGTAAPFLDAAVQSVNDGGLLCVTCTDLAVLAGSNYPEKCFSNYGGTPLKAEFMHEGALRLVLNSISVSASRYGRYIKPQLCLSIDFYVRLFIRVYTGPVEVKKAMTNTATVYICHTCQNTHLQPMGRVSEKMSKKDQVLLNYHTISGPPTDQKCEECGGNYMLGGPLWSGPLHDREFVGKMLGHAKSDAAEYKTKARIVGMLSIAQAELTAPFYFTQSKLAGSFHSQAPSQKVMVNAILNAGYSASATHALAGGIKTDAPRSILHDIIRAYIADGHAVKMENIKEGSPARVLLAKEASLKADFSNHPKADAAMLKDVKIIRFQENPAENWGPQRKAVSYQGKKAKKEEVKSETAADNGAVIAAQLASEAVASMVKEISADVVMQQDK